MVETMYSHIFIDLDDTLWHFDRNAHAALEVSYHRLGIASYYPEYEPFYRAYKSHNDYLWGLYHHGKITRQELMDDRFRHPLALAGCTDTATLEAINRDYLDNLVQQRALHPHALTLLNYLQPKYNGNLYIVSNGFEEVQYRKLQHSGLTPYFKQVFLSDQIGYTKPHPKIFDYIIDATAVQRPHAIFIGDNYEADILGAMNSQIDQIYFNPQHKPIAGAAPTFMVDDLAKIMEIL